MSKRNSVLLLTALITLSLAGCGKSSSGGNTVNISGVAADGYLKKAVACFDLNDNRHCDTNEPQATTTAGGQFTIKMVDANLLNSHSVVVKISTNTIDEDTGSTVSSSYTLMAPPGKYAFISPITTEITSLMEIRQISTDDATSLLKQALGFANTETVDLFADYIAKSQLSDALVPRYQLLRQEAKLIATILSNNQKTLTTAVGALTDPTDTNPIVSQRKKIDPNTKMKPITRILGEDIWGAMSRIRELAITRLTGTFSATELSTLASATAVNTSNIEADINAKITESSTPILNNFISTSLDGSAQFIRFTNSSNKTIYTRTDRNFDGSHFNFTRNDFDTSTSSWIVNTTASPQFTYGLNTDTGEWGKEGSSTTTVSFDAKGFTATSVMGRSTHFGGEEKNLSGLKISENTHLSHVNSSLAPGNITDSTAIFSSGAKYYIWFVKTLNDQYFIKNQREDGNCINTLPDKSLTYGSGPLDCNIVVTRDKNRTPTQALTLDDVFASSDSVVHYLDLGNNRYIQLTRNAVGDTSGVAHIVDTNGVGSSPISFTANSSWELKTFGSTQVITVKLTPTQLINRNEEESSWIFAVVKGAVRQGYLIPKGTEYINDRLVFNNIAKDDIDAQFRF
jgi:hypothetical protein